MTLSSIRNFVNVSHTRGVFITMATVTTSLLSSAGMATSAISSATGSAPQTLQPYKLLAKQQTSPDSAILRFALPETRPLLGNDPDVPTCIKVKYTHTVDDEHSADEPSTSDSYSKSYSPISHPSTPGYFELLVKSYPYTPGGGVGKFLVDMSVGDTISATVKSERMMHGSPAVLERNWKNVGMVAGGTGIAPHIQILRILLRDDPDAIVKLLFINRHSEDILLKTELDALVRQYPRRFTVTYSLTGVTKEEHDRVKGPSSMEISATGELIDTSDTFEYGRGSVDMIRRALPPPSSQSETGTMIFVCGMDGFVEHWSGPVMRAPSVNGKKGPKIQGPLLGLLKDAGYDASEVFKY